MIIFLLPAKLSSMIRALGVNEYLGLKERTLKDLSRIASLYGTMGKPEEAARFRQRAKEIISSPK